MDFAELVVAVHDALNAARLPHAFGGALALAYAAEPRGTQDIDVNVFIPFERLGSIATALEPLGLTTELDPAPLPISGVRFRHPTEPFPVDVFPSLDDLYDEIAQRRVVRTFGCAERRLPFLSAEDLCVFKLSFNRAKDWVDLRAIRSANPALDTGYIARQLLALRGPTMHPRLARFRSLA